MASSGNTISIVDFPQSGISVFYLKGKYVIFWPRQDKSVSEDLKPAAAAASIRQQDAHPFAVTSNLAATSWIKGTDNSRVFLQGNDSALQEISLEQNGAGWTSTFYRVGGNLPPAPAIRVRKGTSIAVTSDQSDNSKLGGEHFGCTLFYQGTDNRIYFMQSSDPGFYTAPLPVASEPATEGTTIQAFQYGDRAEHLYVTFTVPNPDRFVRYKFEKPTQYNNLGTFRNVTPDFIYPAGITMTGLSFAAVRVALADGSPLEQYRFYAQLKKASGKPSLVEYIGAPDSSETTVTLVKGSLEIMDSDANPAKDNSKS
ncbi:hypothetical protein BC834DRAFT_555777 [Gloeopeniophorella convolvens]|nr:hypothetical protein BC834DRAFT_555777 [Gloeopeniophorella convolvens]